MVNFEIITADVTADARVGGREPFHALLSDPPYHLASIAQRFGDPGAAPAKDGVMGRRSKGFMGQQWDGGGVAFDPATWYTLAQALYPGAFGFAYCGARTFHRVAVAIEDAGFVMSPALFGWGYGSGFTSPTRIDTNAGGDAWAGHRYGADTLNPSLEPILMFNWPVGEGRRIDAIIETGAGAVNVDGGRVATGDDLKDGSNMGFKTKNGVNDYSQSPLGRWPKNLALHHAPTCDADACGDGCAVKALGGQSGDSTSSGNIIHGAAATGHVYNSFNEGPPRQGKGDSGTAARYFFNGDWAHEIDERLATGETVRYHAKPSTQEKEAGLADVLGGNIHPTVKSITMAKWLASLLLPPPEYAPRRLLVPFSGSGTEIIGAMLAGWEIVVGIEQSAEFADIARRRCAWWRDRAAHGQTDPTKILDAAADVPDNQMRLF